MQLESACILENDLSVEIFTMCTFAPWTASGFDKLLKCFYAVSVFNIVWKMIPNNFTFIMNASQSKKLFGLLWELTDHWRIVNCS